MDPKAIVDLQVESLPRQERENGPQKKIVKGRQARKTWEKIRDELPGRSLISCRLRYHSYLRKAVLSEDEIPRLATLYKRYEPSTQGTRHAVLW